ncbi:SGNH/GDSL hydrolase family protein [Oceanobacillus halophilus]|uniref:SGNH hydrolase-type esterase domain-containing protein n=1 Tax=Oceanobacillus halophilus TaxID=930130 RepID=A0A494ZXK7_9BACI|nr:SGNH/GDSL hydrolase family protein [Oceanobacillus halophilus]RKQ31494.1 hypothetical protein D8M06_13455 [Oceanobacillus halophilus]
MKHKLFYIIGSILLGIAIILILFNVLNSDDSPSQQALLEDIEIIEEQAEEEQIMEEEPVMEVPEEEDQQDNPEPKDFPERISEVVQSTIEFFKNNIHIVAIGDSLTQGVGDSTNRGGYIGILERTINQNKEIAEFENFGKRGQRSAQLLNRMDNEEVTSAISKADIVLITIGANDIMQVAKENIMNLTLHDFIEQRVSYENNLQEIVTKIQNVNEDTNIYLVGFYNPFEKYFQDIKELDMIVETYNSTTRTIAEEHPNVTFIPTVDLFQDAEINLFAEDNFHPNYHGYHRIAERVLNHITNEES